MLRATQSLCSATANARHARHQCNAHVRHQPKALQQPVPPVSNASSLHQPVTYKLSWATQAPRALGNTRQGFFRSFCVHCSFTQLGMLSSSTAFEPCVLRLVYPNGYHFIDAFIPICLPGDILHITHSTLQPWHQHEATLNRCNEHHKGKGRQCVPLAIYGVVRVRQGSCMPTARCAPRLVREQQQLLLFQTFPTGPIDKQPAPWAGPYRRGPRRHSTNAVPSTLFAGRLVS